MNNLLKNTVTIHNKVWPRPSGNRKLTSIAAYSAHLKYSSQKCIMNIPSRQLVMKYLIHVLFNDQLIIIMVYIFHTKNHMYMISFIRIMWHSVKSSWELVLIVIQKPNSNKVFLSYLIIDRKYVKNYGINVHGTRPFLIISLQ